MEKLNLDTKNEVIKNFIAQGTNYFEDVYDIIRGFDINLVTKIRETFETMLKRTEEIDNVIKSKLNLQNVVLIFDYMAELEANMSFILSIVENNTYSNVLVINMSETFTANIQTKKINMRTLYDKYITLSAADRVLFGEIKQIKPEEVDKIIDDGKYLQGNKFITYLIGVIYEDAPRARRLELRKHIEKLKDGVLEPTQNSQIILSVSSTTSDTAKKNKYTTRSIVAEKVVSNADDKFSIAESLDPIEKMVVRYNLVPVSGNFPLDELLTKLFKCNTLDKLKKLYTVVIINKIYKSPIDFNVLPLINTAYAVENNLLVSETAGINNKILERYNNVIQYKNINAATTSIEYYHNDDANEAVIIETINGINYRIMSNQSAYTVAPSVAYKIAHNITLRPLNYNNIIANEILNKCYDKKINMLLIDYESAKKQLPDIDTLRNAIINDFAAEFDAAKTPKNYDEFRSFVMNKELVASIVGNQLFNKYNVNKNNPEDAMSFIKIVEEIIKRFYKELTDKMSDVILMDRVFKEKSASDLKDHLKGIYRQLIRKVIDTLDSPPSMWKTIDLTLKEYILTKKGLF